MEQRRTRRFKLQLPLSITRTGAERVTFAGHTDNISSSGVLFTADREPDLGGPIEYIITLNHEGPQSVNLRCMGKVLRTGRIQVITNVGVLTEGFDDPGGSCIAMARPTRSEGLYAQCVGRGTRLFPGKKNCLILDFVDLSALSLCTLPSLFGVPRDLDLRGGDVSEARQVWNQILFDHPGFELEARALTLPEIQERSASFDPLTLQPNAEVRAISTPGGSGLSTVREG